MTGPRPRIAEGTCRQCKGVGSNPAPLAISHTRKRGETSLTRTEDVCPGYVKIHLLVLPVCDRIFTKTCYNDRCIQLTRAT